MTAVWIEHCRLHPTLRQDILNPSRQCVLHSSMMWFAIGDKKAFSVEGTKVSLALLYWFIM